MRPTRSPSTPSPRTDRQGRRGLSDRRGVHRVVTAHDLQQEGGVLDRVGERTDLVEARCERNQPVAGDDAVGGLHADDAAQRRRLADRSAGVRAERARGEAGGHRGRAATGRTARHPGQVVGVAGRTEGRVLGGGAHGELVEVGLADDDGTGRGQPLDDRGVVRRSPTLEDPRRAGRRDAPGAHVVLQRHRHAGQRSGILAGRHPGVDRAPRPARASSASTRLKAWTSRLPLRDAGQVRLDHLGRRGRARSGRPAAISTTAAARSRCVMAPHPRIGGTRKRPSSAAGAAASTSSRSRVGADDVVRSTFWSGSGWVIGHDVVEVERVDVPEVVEHRRQLLGVALASSSAVSSQAGQPGDVGDVGRRDATGHGDDARGPSRSWSSTSTSSVDDRFDSSTTASATAATAAPTGSGRGRRMRPADTPRRCANTTSDTTSFTRQPHRSWPVDAQPLDPEPHERVAGDVHREQLRARRSGTGGRSDQPAAQEQAPQRLVEERRMEGGPRRVAGRHRLVGRDLERPRQVGRSPEQLLVPPVPPAADGLGQRRAPGRWRTDPPCSGMPRRMPAQMPTATPSAMPPQMPRPPSQILKASSHRPSKRRQSVMTWYSREPMTPAGTAHSAMYDMSSRVPTPRLRGAGRPARPRPARRGRSSARRRAG